MKAMLWKELRENFKWALLAMIGLGLAEVYGLYYIDQQNPNNRGITLCSPTFLMATSLGNAIVGLLIGLVQILPEQRRDQWAALLHRPVSRAVIFRGKAFAGLLLYLFATVPPFLLCFYLAATPGHFVAPFVPELVLPGVSDIGVGAAYYFAALVVALQRGSWFGARTFALLAAVYLSCSVNSMHYFYVVMEAAVIMAFILFTAAWGAMLSNGKFSDRPGLARWALLASVFYGVCGLGLLASILIAAGEQQQNYYGSEYKITQDGQPIVIKVNKDLTTTVADLAGNIIHDERYIGRRSYDNEIEDYAVTYLIGDRHDYEPRDDYFNYRLSYEHIQEIEQYGEFQPIQWFYLYGPKYAVGIDRRTKTATEIVDRTGFQPVGTPIKPFTGTQSRWYQVPSLIQEGNDALICDLDKEKITPLPGTDPTPIYGMEEFSYTPANGKGSDQIIVVARGQGIQIYDSNGAAQATLPYNPAINLDRWGTVSFGNNHAADRFYIKYSPSAWIPWEERKKMPFYLDEMDAKGSILHSYTLPPLPEPPGERTWQSYLSDSLRAPGFWFWDLAYQKIGASFGIKSLIKEADYSFNTQWQGRVETSERVLLYSLVFALIALAWARSAGMSWPRVWAWTIFVLAFNLVGLITFRLVADWPVRVPCPECRRKRPIEENKCPHCGAGWPLPAARGIEIFDDKAPVATAEVQR
jgi:hypothetical protein